MLTADAALTAWVNGELDGLGITIHHTPTVGTAVVALVDTRPPRPQILVADFDAMSPADVFQLHSIRERGWFGSLIAIGAVSDDLKTSLNIDRAITRPLGSEILRTAVNQIGLDRPTAKMRKLTL